MYALRSSAHTSPSPKRRRTNLPEATGRRSAEPPAANDTVRLIDLFTFISLVTLIFLGVITLFWVEISKTNSAHLHDGESSHTCITGRL